MPPRKLLFNQHSLVFFCRRN